MSPIIELVASRPVGEWKSFMTYRFIVDSANVLSEEIDQEAFHFYSTVLNGVPEQRERWERGVMRVGLEQSGRSNRTGLRPASLSRISQGTDG